MSLGKIGKLTSAVSRSIEARAASKNGEPKAAKTKSGSEVRRADSTKAPTRSAKLTVARPSQESDRIEAVRGGDVGRLDLDPEETKSDPGAAREVLAIQASSAQRTLGGTVGPSEFDELAEQTASGPIEAAELEPPEAFSPGAELPSVPELADPTQTDENPLTGLQETFDVDGTKYIRTSEPIGLPSGSVRTEYQVDGVTYSEVQNKDGSRQVQASRPSGPGEASHSRTVEYDTEGQLVTDHTKSTESRSDPDSDEYHYATRTETFASDGTRTITEKNETDGRLTSVGSRTETPNGESRRAHLDLPRELDPETFSEQLAGFAESGDPGLLYEAISGLEPERLQALASTAFEEGNPSIYHFVNAASAAASAAGPGAARPFATGLHDALTDSNAVSQAHSGYFDLYKAFESVGSSGGDVSLGVELIDQLRKTAEGGDTDSTLARYALNGPGGANGAGVAGGVESGLRFHSSSFGEAADRVDQLDRDLSYLSLNYGPFMSANELTAAQEEFRREHADEYQAYEDKSAGLVSNVNNIQRLQEMRAEYDGDNSRKDPFARDLDLDSVSGDLLTRVRQASGTEQGRAELAVELERVGRGQPSFLSDLDSLGGDSEEAKQEREALRKGVFDTSISFAAEAAASGSTTEVRKQLDGLAATFPDFPPESLELLEGLANGAADLSERLPEALNVPGDPESTDRLRRAGALLGLAGLAHNGIDIVSGNADAEAMLSTLADGTELGTEVFKNALSKTFSPSSVRTVGRVAGGVGVALSAVDTVRSLADGDIASAGLSLASTIGGTLLLSSSTGVGAIISVAALAGHVGLAQYRKVDASNHYESKDTERFISHALADANLTSGQRAEALHQLRNADEDGRLTGVLLRQTADQAGISPRELLTQIAQLSENDIKAIVTKGHRVDFEDDESVNLEPEEVADFLEFIRTEFGIATRRPTTGGPRGTPAMGRS